MRETLVGVALLAGMIFLAYRVSSRSAEVGVVRAAAPVAAPVAEKFASSDKPSFVSKPAAKKNSKVVKHANPANPEVEEINQPEVPTLVPAGQKQMYGVAMDALAKKQKPLHHLPSVAGPAEDSLRMVVQCHELKKGEWQPEGAPKHCRPVDGAIARSRPFSASHLGIE